MIKYELARYDDYKNSGVEWLEDVPENWVVKRLEDVTFVIDPQPDHRAPALAEENGYPYIGIRDLNKDGSLNFETARSVEISAVEKQENSFKVVCGDILFCKVGTLGEPRIIVPKGRFALSATLVLIKVKNNDSNIFLKYALDSSCVFNQINYFGSGSTRPALGIKQIRKFLFSVPPLAEQKAIADYLDTKTAEIDRKIDLFTQKATKYGKLKKSIINEVVTRGLDKTVAMKDSGVEWIGEVPEHWEVKRLKELGFLYSGLSGKKGDDFTDEHEFSSNFIPFVNIANNQYISTTDMKKVIVYPNEKQNNVKQNDLFFLMSSENHEDIGKSALLKVDMVDTYLNSFCRGFRFTRKDIVANFVNYLLASEKCRNSVSVEGKGFTRINLKIEKINDLLLMIPSYEEQKSLADYLDIKTAHIDRIIETINIQIEKLKELRKTLINDVVTGKIKVYQEGERI